MKTINIPKGVKIACGREVNFVRLSKDTKENVRLVCGKDGECCPECTAWNDANVEADE